jgi:hypothetical protein
MAAFDGASPPCSARLAPKIGNNPIRPARAFMVDAPRPAVCANLNTFAIGQNVDFDVPRMTDRSRKSLQTPGLEP